MSPIHLAIIEDYLIIQESLVEYFGLQDAIEVVLVASSVEYFLEELLLAKSNLVFYC